MAREPTASPAVGFVSAIAEMAAKKTGNPTLVSPHRPSGLRCRIVGEKYSEFPGKLYPFSQPLGRTNGRMIRIIGGLVAVTKIIDCSVLCKRNRLKRPVASTDLLCSVPCREEARWNRNSKRFQVTSGL